MTNKLRINSLIVTTFMTLLAFAHANDFQEEVFISSDNQEAQLKTNVIIFKENVEVIHGRRTITANKLEAHRRAELGDNKQLLIATGSPATFSEKQIDGTLLSASANEVRYDVDKRILIIKGNAKINQAGQTITAQLITYDMEKQLIKAQRDNTTNDRVHTILTPPKKTVKKQSGEQP